MAAKTIMMVRMVVVFENPRGRNTKRSSSMGHESTHRRAWHLLQLKPLSIRFVLSNRFVDNFISMLFNLFIFTEYRNPINLNFAKLPLKCESL